MGKNHRHKKALKADKAKVKLKQTKTKFLPKGQNVTNTEFKIRPIVLTQQLQEKEASSPLSKRKLDVKDLLSRLKHYNENIRHLACEELTEMLKFYSEEIITQHLSQVILGISSLMQDRERKVRKATAKAIKIILDVIPDEKLEPFYNYFVINLCCTMTNINPNIQEDSLDYVSIFIDKDMLSTCGLITQYSEQILPDFLTLISKLRTNADLGRTLTVNLGSSVSSVKFKIRVFTELMKILKCILKTSIIETNEESSIVRVDDVCKVNWFGLYKKEYSSTLDYSKWNWDSVNNKSQKSSTNGLEKNILSLVPLLYETWIEVKPGTHANKTHNERTPLDLDTSIILICIVHMLNSLQNYSIIHDLKNEVFGTQDCDKLLDSLLLHFPFCSKDSKTIDQLSKLKLLGIRSNQSFVLLNIQLSMTYIITKVFFLNKTAQYEKELNKVFSYLNKCILNKSLDKPNLQLLIALIRYCFKMWKTSSPDLTKLLENAVSIDESSKDNDTSIKLQCFPNFLDP